MYIVLQQFILPEHYSEIIWSYILCSMGNLVRENSWMFQAQQKSSLLLPELGLTSCFVTKLYIWGAYEKEPIEQNLKLAHVL